jgi:hypothetical protein
MNLKASEVIGTYYKRLPLKEQAKIINANALRLDWEKIVPRNELSYILGNPPFNGARTMSQEQKSDMRLVFSNQKNTGNLDYVTAWYKKASEYMKETQVKCAFVSTNSISQGEQPAILWKPLMSEGIHINFGQPTFKWANEAKGQAAVHCIIIGFSNQQTKHDLNQYLLDAPVVFIENRQHPLCDVPEMWIGNKPIDGGNYLFSLEEKNEFIKKEPRSERWFYKWIGSDELINKYFRYCLLLKDCPLEELRTMHECMKRVKAVQNYRQASKSVPTKKLANTPLSFHVEKFPSSEYIAIPEISSEKRNYIPIDFIKPEILASNRLKIIPDATFYHFGVLTSSIHMAWVKTVCGRFELRYCYSKDIVYNNFPWPKHSEKYVATIEQTAKAILRVRKQFPKASLADLYDPLTMPKELLQAHLNNDKAVSQAYGFKFKNQTDDTYVKALFRLYQQLTNY